MPSAYNFNEGFWPLWYLRNEVLGMIWPRAEKFTTFEFHLWSCFCVGEWILAIWELFACVHACVCILALEAETRQRSISTPWEHRAWRSDDKGHWKSVALLGHGVASALARKLLHIFPLQKYPESSHTYYISCFPGGDLLSWIQPFNQTGFYFCFSFLCKVTPEDFQQLFMAFYHCTAQIPWGFFPLNDWGILSAGAKWVFLTSPPQL